MKIIIFFLFLISPIFSIAAKEATMRTTCFKKLDPLFINRWSPRAFKSDPIPEEDLKTIFEAARWSPSCYNEQPWVYVYGQSPSSLKKIQETLVEFNNTWASKAPVLVMVFVKKTFDKNNEPNRWASFDVGASWMSLALQAAKLGYITHAMGGFDAQKALDVAGLDSADYDAITVIAIGKEGDPTMLPDFLQKMESPSDRKSLDAIVRQLD